MEEAFRTTDLAVLPVTALVVPVDGFELAEDTLLAAEPMPDEVDAAEEQLNGDISPSALFDFASFWPPLGGTLRFEALIFTTPLRCVSLIFDALFSFASVWRPFSCLSVGTIFAVFGRRSPLVLLTVALDDMACGGRITPRGALSIFSGCGLVTPH
jgi:hypothetical protein